MADTQRDPFVFDDTDASQIDPFIFDGTETRVDQGDPFVFDDSIVDETAPTFSYINEDYANSWRNRFNIATDRMQSSLYKGLNLISDSMSDYLPDISNDLKQYSLKGIERNRQQIAAKPQPTRSGSFTDRYGEIKSDFQDGEILDALQSTFLLAKDLSADALPSLGISGGALIGAAATSPVIGAVPVVGGTAATLTTLIAPLIPGFLMGGGETYEEAQRLGATPEEAKNIALTAGGVIGVLDRVGAAAALNSIIKSFGRDKVFDVLSKQYGTDVAKEAIENASEKATEKFVKQSITKNVIKTATRGALTEAGTEAAQERVQIAAAGEAAGLGMSPYSSAEINKRMIDAAAIGWVGGKIAGTGAGVVSGLQHNNVARRSEELAKKEEEVREIFKDIKNEDELAKIVADTKKQYKPSIVQSLIGKAITPLQGFSTRSALGYEIVNKLENYFNNVNSEVGNFSTQIDDAFQNIRRDFKLPLIMGSMSKANNKKLFDVLVHKKETKDPKVLRAAEVLRKEVLGEIIRDEVKITHDSLLSSLKQNLPVLPEVTEGLRQKTLTKEKANRINNQYNTLLEVYNKGVLDINNQLYQSGLMFQDPTTKGYDRAEQDQGILLNNLINETAEFKSLNNTVTVPLIATGLFQMMKEAGVEMDFAQDYLPRLYKFNTPWRWRRAKKILADQLDEKGNRKGEGWAQQVVDHIRGNEGINFAQIENINLDFDPQGETLVEGKKSFEKRRAITNETFKKLDDAGLVERNVKNIIDRYLIQAAQRKNIKELKNYIEPRLKQLNGKEGQINKDELNHLKSLYEAYQNRYKPIQSEFANKASRMYLTFQYMLTLPLATLTALTEPLIILSRLGPKDTVYGLTKATQNTLRQAARSIFPKLKKSESEQAFNSILQGYDGTLAERLGSIQGVDVSRTITDKFFKTILLTQITQLSRDIAFQAAQRQMKEDIVLVARNNLSKSKTTRAILEARRRLQGQGLIKENLKLDTPNTSEALLWAEGKTEGVPPDLIRKSLSKFVDEIIMAPNVINRPLWMSNPHLAMFAQLKGFMFAFGSTVGMRAYKEVIKPLFKGRVALDEAAKYAIALILIAAGSIGIRELKDQIRYGNDPSPWKDLEGWDVWHQALIGSNIFGPGTIVDQALNASEYGSRPSLVILGPGFQTIDNTVNAVGQLAYQKNSRELARLASSLIPGLSAIIPQKKKETTDYFEDIIDEYLNLED